MTADGREIHGVPSPPFDGFGFSNRPEGQCSTGLPVGIYDVDKEGTGLGTLSRTPSVINDNIPQSLNGIGYVVVDGGLILAVY